MTNHDTKRNIRVTTIEKVFVWQAVFFFWASVIIAIFCCRDEDMQCWRPDTELPSHDVLLQQGRSQWTRNPAHSSPQCSWEQHHYDIFQEKNGTYAPLGMSLRNKGSNYEWLGTTSSEHCYLWVGVKLAKDFRAITICQDKRAHVPREKIRPYEWGITSPCMPLSGGTWSASCGALCRRYLLPSWQQRLVHGTLKHTDENCMAHWDWGWRAGDVEHDAKFAGWICRYKRQCVMRHEVVNIAKSGWLVLP